MTWLNNDVVQITANYALDGEPMSCVFHYELQQDSDATEILTEFDNIVAAGMRSVQSSSLQWTSLKMKNITNGASEAELTYNPPSTGVRPGEYLPTYSAYGFKLVRSTTATDSGAKRVGGCAESDVQGNVPEASVVPALQALATIFATPVAFPVGGGDMVPIIYRAPSGPDPEVRNVVQSGLFMRMTTQNSRKKY